MSNFHNLQDSKRAEFENLLQKRLPELIKSNSTVLDGDVTLDLNMFPIDRANPVVDNGTEYFMVGAAAQITRPDGDSIGFNINLLKVPDFKELGFRIKGNNKQMLDSYERTTGLTFDKSKGTSVKGPVYTAQMLGNYGRKIQFVYDDTKRMLVDLKGVSKVKKDGKCTVLARDFMEVISGLSAEQLIAKFGYCNPFILQCFTADDRSSKERTKEKSFVEKVDSVLIALEGVDRAREITSIDRKISIINRDLYNPYNFNLGNDCTQSLSYIQSFANRATGKILECPIDFESGELSVHLQRGIRIDSQTASMLDKLPIDSITVKAENDVIFELKKYSNYTFRLLGAEVKEEVPELNLSIGDIITESKLDELNKSEVSSIKAAYDGLGTQEYLRRKSDGAMTSEDLVLMFSVWTDNLNGLNVYDTQFELTNKMCISFADRACEYVGTSLRHLVSMLSDSLSLIGDEESFLLLITDFAKQINTNELIERIENVELGGGQMAEMCNPLSFISKSDKIFTKINPDNISDEMIAIQDTQEGRLDAFDVPESGRIGSVHCKTMFSETTESGELTAPYLKVENGVVVDDKPVMLKAIDEKGVYIAAWDETFINKDGTPKSKVKARLDGDVVTAKVSDVKLKEYSNLQSLSVAHSMVTFPGHSNAKRITMSCNQGRQALICVNVKRPNVGTGAESVVDFGNYKGKRILEMYLTARKNLTPALQEFKDRIMESTLKLDSMETTGETRAFTFIVTEVQKINEELGREFESTITVTVPYMMRNFDESTFSFRINHKKDRMYSPEDVVLHSNAYSMDKPKRVDLVDFGAYQSEVSEHAFDSGMAIGQDILVGYKTSSSGTIEDAIFLSDELIHDDTFTHVRLVLKEYELKQDNDIHEEFCYSGQSKRDVLDSRGLAKPGVVLKPGEIFAAVQVSRNGGSPKVVYKELSPYEEGQVIRSEIVVKQDGSGKANKQIGRVLLAYRATIECGDKLAGRHGNKGVVAQILPAEQMPFDPKSGRSIQICLNPLGVPSRQNISQLLEVTLGMCRMLDGNSQSYVSPYHKDDLKFVEEQAEIFDVKPVMLVDGRTGVTFKRPINVGVLHMNKLQQTAARGINSVGLGGSVDPTHMQPLKGAKRKGGQSISEMENWCLHGVGAMHVLNDLYGFQSDDIVGRNEYIDKLHEGETVDSIESTNNSHVSLLSMARPMGVDVVFEDGDFVLRPLVDAKTKSLSPSPVTSPGQLHSPRHFGYQDSLVERQAAKDKWSWMNLNTEIVHPMWLESTSIGRYIPVLVNRHSEQKTTVEKQCLTKNIAAGLLKETSFWDPETNLIFDTTKKDPKSPTGYEQVPNNSNLQTGMQAIVSIFKKANFASIEKELESVYNSIDASDREKKRAAAESLAGIRDLIKAGVNASDYVITTFPIIPTTYRPQISIGNATGKGDASTGFDMYYQQILLAAENAKEVPSNENAKKIYDRINDFVGFTASDQKYKGILAYFTGKGENNHGDLRRAVQSKRIFCSGRAVITPAEYRIKPTQLGVPITMLVNMGSEVLSAFVLDKRASKTKTISFSVMGKLLMAVATKNKREFVRIYGKQKYDLENQFLMVPDKAYRQFKEWIVDFFEGRNGCIQQVVLCGRQPSLHKYSIRAFYPVVLDTRAVQINSLVCKGFNADFDGDKMWIALLMTEQARLEALEKLTTKQDMINPKDSSIMLSHTQDISLGCYVATMLENNNTVMTQSLKDCLHYDSTAALENDVFAGIVEPWDLVCLTLQVDEDEYHRYLSTAGRILFNDCLGELGFTDKPYENTLNIQGIKPERYNELAFDGLITCGKPGKGDYRYFKLSDICMWLYENYKEDCVELFHEITLFGFRFSDLFGVSIGITDMKIQSNKEELFAKVEAIKDEIEQDYAEGLISEEDRREAILSLYVGDSKQSTDEIPIGINDLIQKDIIKNLDRNNNLFIMMDSGARGNPTQIMHMCGSVGVLEKTTMETMSDSIHGNYFEGLTANEVHMTSYSARNGIASTQHETKNAGYATRKVVYMIDNIKIVDNDCGKTDWWYDVEWDDRIDELSLFKPTKEWFDANLLGQEILVNGDVNSPKVITEADYNEYAAGFREVVFSEKSARPNIVAGPEILIGASIKGFPESEKYFGKLASENGRFNSDCAFVFNDYKLMEVSTSFGVLSSRYKMTDTCRSQLRYRLGKDLPKLHHLKDPVANEDIDVIQDDTLDQIERDGTTRIQARIMLDCKCKYGVCAKCYGLKYSTLQLPRIGEIVGTEAAQAIGEPAAQLTMNKINNGGVAGASLASGVQVFASYLNGTVVGGRQATTAVIPEHSGYLKVLKSGSSASIAVEPEQKSCSMCQQCMELAQEKTGIKACPLTNGGMSEIMCIMSTKVPVATVKYKSGEYVHSGYPVTTYTAVSDNVVSVKGNTELKYVMRRKEMIWVDNYYNLFKSQSIDINARHFEILSLAQNQDAVVLQSKDARIPAGSHVNVRNVTENDDLVLDTSVSTLSDTILRNSGLLAALTFADHSRLMRSAVMSQYRSSFAHNTSSLGMITLGQDLTSTKPKDINIKEQEQAATIVEDLNGSAVELVEVASDVGNIQMNATDAFASLGFSDAFNSFDAPEDAITIEVEEETAIDVPELGMSTAFSDDNLLATERSTDSKEETTEDIDSVATYAEAVADAEESGMDEYDAFAKDEELEDSADLYDPFTSDFVDEESVEPAESVKQEPMTTSNAFEGSKQSTVNDVMGEDQLDSFSDELDNSSISNAEESKEVVNLVNYSISIYIDGIVDYSRSIFGSAEIGQIVNAPEIEGCVSIGEDAYEIVEPEQILEFSYESVTEPKAENVDGVYADNEDADGENEITNSEITNDTTSSSSISLSSAF